MRGAESLGCQSWGADAVEGNVPIILERLPTPEPDRRELA